MCWERNQGPQHRSEIHRLPCSQRQLCVRRPIVSHDPREDRLPPSEAGPTRTNGVPLRPHTSRVKRHAPSRRCLIFCLPRVSPVPRRQKKFLPPQSHVRARLQSRSRLPTCLLPSRHSPPSPAAKKPKARDILAAIRTLKTIEQRAAARHAGGAADARPLRRLRPGRPVDLPRPGHRPLQGRHLAGPRRGAADRCSRPRNTTAPSAPPSTPSTPRPTVIAAMHEALARLGVPGNATVLEPGCGTGNFMSLAPQGHALHRRRAGPHLRPHRQGAPSRPGHPHRELPRHAAARRTASTP